MTGILSYIRSVMGWADDNRVNITLKRTRDCSDDDPPIMKKYRTVTSNFPKIAMPSDAEEDWVRPSRVGSESRVRYIPVRRDDSGPSTSTPSVRIPQTTTSSNLSSKNVFLERQSLHLPGPSREILTHRSIPSNRLFSKNDLQSFKSISKPNDAYKSHNSMSSYFIKSSQERPLRFTEVRKKPANTSINLDDEADEEVYVIENGENSKGSENYPTEYSDHANEQLEINDPIELSDNEDYDVIFVKRDKQPSSSSSDSIEFSQRDRETSFTRNGIPSRLTRPSFKIFKSRNSDPGNVSISRNMSPRTTFHSSGRFKTPPVISKTRLFNTQAPFWKSKNFNTSVNYSKSANRSIGSQMSEATRAAIAKSFRLDEKKHYEKLIKLSSLNFSSKSSPIDSVQDPFAEARVLLQKLNFNSEGLGSKSTESNKDFQKLVNGQAEKHNEYDPVTIASINLSDSEPEVLTSADDASTTSSVRITPVNSLKLYLKDKPLAKNDWLTNFNNKYENMQLEKKSQLEKCTFKSDIISKVNRDQWKTTIEQNVKADMTLPISILEEPAEEAVGLPELSDQQQHIINNALRPGPAQQILIEKFSLSIHRRDIQTLAGLNWLNDEVINFYMNLLMERSQQKKNVPKVYATNTFFYPKLMQSGHPGLKRWTRKVDIFSHDLMIVPVHLGVHWCMCIIDFRDKTIKYYDSMGGANMECCHALLRYLEDECMDKKREKFNGSPWKKECLKKIPQQMNGSDCGMFSCTFAEFICRDAPISFSQNDMPYLRRKMILEIVKGELLL